MAAFLHGFVSTRLRPAASRLLIAWCGALVAVPAGGQVSAEPRGESPSADLAPTSAPPTADQIAAWIDELGHDSFAVRQSATERLLAGGYSARAALLEVVDAPDPETRAAARRLVTLIEQTEFDRRLAEFAADVAGRQGVTLPGWTEFGELVGTDEPARAMFVDMHRCEAALLAAAFQHDADDEDHDWQERLFRLHRWQTISGQRNAAPPLGSCATMLFLGSLPDRGDTERGAIGIGELARRPPIREAILGEGEQNVVVRRLLLAWIENCPVRHDRVLGARLQLISLYKLTEALPLAVAVARGEPPFLTAAASNRLVAILAIGSLGSVQHADDLEPLLADNTVVAVARPPGNLRTVQIRDVALATMVHLTDQQLADYGFIGAQRNSQMLFNPQSLGMADDEARAAAAAKWREWKAAQERAGE